MKREKMDERESGMRDKNGERESQRERMEEREKVMRKKWDERENVTG